MTSRLTKAIRDPRKAWQRLIYELMSYVGDREYRQFLVLSRSRTGSNMLVTFLNSHPEIRADGEIFQRLNQRDYRDVLARAFSKQPRRIKAKGFKIFYYHPLDGDTRIVFDEITGLASLRVIHLKRRNILRTLISRKIAGYQDVWLLDRKKRKASGRPKVVSFSRVELEEGFRETRDWEQRGEALFSKHRVLTIYYEDLVSDPSACLGQVMDFLGVEKVDLETSLRKQNPQKLRDLVSNYDDLKSDFADTEWQRFFSE